MPSPGTVSGTVRDDGRYQLTGLQPGRWNIKVSAGGCQDSAAHARRELSTELFQIPDADHYAGLVPEWFDHVLAALQGPTRHPR